MVITQQCHYAFYLINLYDYISPKRATMHKTKGKTDNGIMEE